MKKLVKINILMISFVFLTGFVPIVSWFAPVATIFSSGNVYKAGLQLLVDQGIQKKTGKNSLMLVKDEIDKNNTNKQLNKKLRKLVEKRINIARQKIQLQNINQ